MMNRAVRWLTAAAVAWVAFAGSASAQEFSNAIIFGDSLSDAGSFSGFLPPGTGRFTTNPGPVWAEILAARFGHPTSPAVAGGTDYAQGGARINDLPGYPNTNPLTANAMPIATQVETYLASAGGKADPNALYTLWGGANDLFYLSTQPDPVAALVAATTGEVHAIATLQAAGARYVVVPNIPDILVTPDGRALAAGDPAAAAATDQAVQLYNSLLYGGLKSAKLRVIPADMFRLVREVTSDGARYGFTNVVDRACTTSSSLTCTGDTLVAPNADQTYIWADGVHPTTGGHALIADYVYSMIVAPLEVGQIAETSARSRTAFANGLYDQLSLVSDKLTGHRAWVTLSGLWSDYEDASSSGVPVTLALGMDAPLSTTLRAGLAGHLGRTTTDYANGGDYRIDEVGVTAYGSYRSAGWHGLLAATLGSQHIASSRAVQLGAAQREMDGSTSGLNLSTHVQFGYDFTSATLRHGPVAGLLWQNTQVSGFSESFGSANASTAIRFDQQIRRSLVSNLGWQALYAAGVADVFARVAWQHEFKNDERMVSATLAASEAPSYALPVSKGPEDTGRVTLGASFPFSHASNGWIVADTTVGSNGSRDTRLQLGFSTSY